MFSDLFCAMRNHDDNFLDLSRAQIDDAAFNDGAITKRKQRLKGAHATRASRGEDNSGYFSHIQKLTTKAQRHKGLTRKMLCGLCAFVVIRKSSRLFLGSSEARRFYNNARRARRVYSRVICLRQFMTKSVLSSGRALM